MTPPTSGCPTPDTLERHLSAGEGASPEITAHVAHCPDCAKYLETARFEQRFADVMGGAPTVRRIRIRALDMPDIPGYRVVEEVSRGGQGVVYRGVQLTTGQAVAAKVLHPSQNESPRSRARFTREIQIAAALNHPGIVRLLDSLTLIDGREALIMEMVEGLPLDVWLTTDPRPDPEAIVDVLAQVAEALHFAHQKGVIHRDLKPSNVLIDPTGRARVLDFGVARWMEGSSAPGAEDIRITLTGEFAGTLAYAAPEQVTRDSGGADTRSDIYAVGVIGYQALAGRLPYSVDGSLETAIHNIINAPVPRPTTPGLSTDVWTVLAKAMAKEPARRYQSAGDLALDLRRALTGEAIDARRDSRWYVLRKAIRRNRLPVAIAAIVVVGALTILGVLAVSNARLTRALDESQYRQLRALVVTGARASAESILWPLFDQRVPRDVDPDTALWSGPLEQKRLLWTFVEMQAQAACLLARPIDGASKTFQVRPDGVIQLIQDDGRIRLFSPTDFSEIPNAARIESAFTTAGMTPSGRFCIVLHDKTLMCIDASTGERLGTRALSMDSTGGPGFARGNGYMALCGKGGELEVYSVPSLELAWRTERAWPLQLPWVHPDRPVLGYLDDQRRLHVLDLSGREPEILRDFLTEGELWTPVDYQTNAQLSLSPDCATAIVTLHLSTHTLDLRSDAPPHRLARGPAYRVGAIIDPLGELFSTRAYGESRVRIWDMETWSELPGLPGHKSTVKHHAFSPDGQRIYTMDIAGVLRAWAAPGRGWRVPLDDPTHFGHDMALSSDGAAVYVADADGLITRTSADPNRPMTPARFGGPAATTVALSEARSMVATSGYAVPMEIAEMDVGGAVTRRITPAGGRLAHSMRFAPNGASLVAALAEGSLVRIDPETGSELARRATPPALVSCIRFTPDSRRVVAGGRDGTIAVLDPMTLSTIRTIQASIAQIRCLEIAPDGRTAAAAGDAGRVLIVDLHSGNVRASERISEDSLFSITWHPSGRCIAVGDRHGQLSILDAESLERVATFSAGSSVMSMAFAPDGDTLFVSALHRPVERWNFSALTGTLAANRP